MNENIHFHVERIDDIPVLCGQLERLQVGSLLNQYCPTHGNW
jgi:hypothetical protein